MILAVTEQLGQLALPVAAVVIILRELRQWHVAEKEKKNGSKNGVKTKGSCYFTETQRTQLATLDQDHSREHPGRPGQKLWWCHADEMLDHQKETNELLVEIRDTLKDGE